MEDIKTIEDLYQSIGGLGKFQIFSIFATLYPEFPTAIVTLLPIYIGAKPENWECIFEDDEENLNSTQNGFINESEICECLNLNGTLYGGDKSIVSEWSLVCDKAWITDFITSVQMTGYLVGGFVAAMIADLIGRKKALFSFCFLLLLSVTASAFSTSPFIYSGSIFISGFAVACYLVVGAVYVVEFLTPKSRVCVVAGLWAEGYLALAPLAYFFQAWRDLILVAIVPILICFISLPFLPESPRWLIQQKKIPEAKAVFEKIANWNGKSHKHIDEILIEKLAAETETSSSKSGEREKTEKVGYLQLLQNQNARGKILIFVINWLTISVMYYFINFNTKNLGGNIYYNIAYMGLIEAIGFPLAIPVNNYLGRKIALIIYLSGSLASFLLLLIMEYNFLISFSEGKVIAFFLVGKFFICGAWATVKVFTAESFPTKIRSSAIGLVTVAAAIGGIISPQLVYLGSSYRSAPFFILGGLSILCLVLAPLTKETKGKPLNESLDEINDMEQEKS